MWGGEARGQHREAMKVLMTNKDLREGVYCLGLSMVRNWWDWMEISIFLFWRWSKELGGGIRYGQKQWQVGTCTRLPRPQIAEIEDSVAEKES